ncbi:MAG: type VI secretion system tip protein VgrG, partial [Proteobacteria bacterium]|nr:type VI secretion system tip protein VgrG [Pseudomonadota bacterium]
MMDETIYRQTNYPISVATPLGEDKLQLVKLQGEERLSGLFHFTLEMVSEDHNLNFDAIVGTTVTVSFHLVDGTTRHVNGVVGRFVQADRDKRFTTYHAELFPWLWQLTMTSDCRIFQNQTVPDIIENVFRDLGCTDFKNSLSSTYAAREYCVQYQESTFDFVSRLMQDEGIFYFFEHEDGKHTLVLADDADAHPFCPGLTEVHWAHLFETREHEDVITHCALEQQMIPGTYAAADFNFETPSVGLLVGANSTNSGMRIYEYPGGFEKKDEGEKKVNIRLEAYEFPQTMLRGKGHCRAFTAGHRFRVAGRLVR